MKPAVEIKNLSIDLDGHQVLKNVTVSMPQGHIIGLLGPSGAGKTTLIRAIVGRHKVDQGEVKVFDIVAGSPALRQRIGYMPQLISTYPDLTVRENLRYFAVMSGYSKREARDVINEVDLTKHADKLVSKLSGGQKSRVSLAAALLGRPPLLILDEPTVGVDPVLRSRLWDIFKGLAAAGTTLIVTSHVMEEANHCQELMLIRSGRLLAYGSPKQLRDHTGTRTIEDSFIKLVENSK